MTMRGRLGSLILHLRREAVPADGASDASLLDRFVAGRDEAAFELLVWRHAPMILGVCRRMLRRTEDAEDAFQAVFLLLARKAASIRRREALAGWLYQTACRVALRAREAGRRRPVAVPPGAEPAAPSAEPDVVWRDVRPVLDEEVARLPAQYRTAVVLCYFQGRSHSQAAAELGCPRGTVAVRLRRARELLRRRLTRRGLALSAAALAVLAAERTARAAAPAVLVHAAAKAAVLFASGKVVAGAASARAVAWTQGVLRTMFLSKMKLAASVVLVLALVGTGAGFLMSRAAAPARQQASAAPPPAGYPAADNRERVDIPALRDGLLVLVGTEIRPGEAVPEGDRVKVEVGFVAAEIVGDDNGPAKIGPEAWWRTLDPTGKKKYIRLTEGGPLPDSLFAVKEEREYRKLRLGDKIEKGQLLAIEDETVALNEVSQKIAKREAAEAEYHEAIKTKEEAIRRANQTEFTFSKGTGQISKDDYEAALLNRDRYIEEEKSKNAARKVAAEELWAALGLLKMHEIRSLDSGVVREILKRRGEAIHGLEPVVRLEVQDAADAPPDKQEAPPPAKPPVATVSVSSPVNGILTDVRVKVGDAVEEGQLLARLDDRLARLDVEQEKAKVVIAQASLQAAQKVLDAASVRDQNIGKLVVNHAVTEEEVRTAKLEVEKAKADVQIKEAGIAQAKAALEAAQLTLEMYEIHSPVRGVIRAIEKSRGEAVKNLDTVVQIEGKPKD